MASRTASRPVIGSSPSGPYSTTSSARIPERDSLSAPPCMQFTKNSTVSRCGANVVMATPYVLLACCVSDLFGAAHSDHCGAAVDHQLHAIDIARVIGG